MESDLQYSFMFCNFEHHMTLHGQNPSITVVQIDTETYGRVLVYRTTWMTYIEMATSPNTHTVLHSSHSKEFSDENSKPVDGI